MSKPASNVKTLTLFVPLRPLSRNLLDRGKLRRRIQLKNEVKAAWLSALSDYAGVPLTTTTLTEDAKPCAIALQQALELTTATSVYAGNTPNFKPTAAKATL